MHDTFQITQNHQLFQGCLISDISFFLNITFSPFFGSNSEKCNIQQICFVSINKTRLQFCNFFRNQISFDCICMNLIIDFGNGSLQVPLEIQPVVFIILEALKFLNQINFELRTNPHSKLKCNIGMSIKFLRIYLLKILGQSHSFFQPNL